jgi:hypothetical protein
LPSHLMEEPTSQKSGKDPSFLVRLTGQIRST